MMPATRFERAMRAVFLFMGLKKRENSGIMNSINRDLWG